VHAALDAVDWDFCDAPTGAARHDIHPYPAKFIPQIPRTIVDMLTQRGDTVLDPFGGSGTTAVEAARSGRPAISIDANPLSELIGRAKLATPGFRSLQELDNLQLRIRTFLLAPPLDAAPLLGAYGEYVPIIANRAKWFDDMVVGELAHIRRNIEDLETEAARDAALVALSKTVLPVSFQDSETRYKSVPRPVSPGEATTRFLRELALIVSKYRLDESSRFPAPAQFVTGDSRVALADVPTDSIDLVVTSPPYGNATDYHLYHRFRLLWLGFDPVELGHIEIGSHLKHQREASGFESYLDDISLVLEHVERTLRPDRYAAFVVGDSLYAGETHKTDEVLADVSRQIGFVDSHIVQRKIHSSKRSFAHAGRRFTSESILFLRTRSEALSVYFARPNYRLHDYEEQLRDREIDRLVVAGTRVGDHARVEPGSWSSTRMTAFVPSLEHDGRAEATWQGLLEGERPVGSRKEPKYVTHGLHPYKGKFYPQLAKSLINESNLKPGARILDPFCGSGTTLLEGYLGGYATYGCDIHPLAARIATAKVGILEVDPILLRAVTEALSRRILEPTADPMAVFPVEAHEEIARWFAPPIARRIGHILTSVRSLSDGVVRVFLEVILSSIVREVSHQDPSDLRIRYRGTRLEDADVTGLFLDRLGRQMARLEHFWGISGSAPEAFRPGRVVAGNNRGRDVYDQLGLSDGTVDLVLTSPPYAMALPYIDTDRLSLLTLMGLTSSKRRPLEHDLTGSRELTTRERREHERSIEFGELDLPGSAREFLSELSALVSSAPDLGFRRQNMPALVTRFLTHMDAVFSQIERLCAENGRAAIVIGDSRMTISERVIGIPTTELVQDIARSHGFVLDETIDISVTVDGMRHMKNSITRNSVLVMSRQ
jgi:DNA modification methylase